MSVRSYAMVAATPATRVQQTPMVKQLGVYRVKFNKSFFDEAPSEAHSMFDTLVEDSTYKPQCRNVYYKRYQLEMVVSIITLLLGQASTTACDELDKKIRTWMVRANKMMVRANKLNVINIRKSEKRAVLYCSDADSDADYDEDYDADCDEVSYSSIMLLMKEVLDFSDMIYVDELYDEAELTYRIIDIAKSSVVAMRLLSKDVWSNVDKKKFDKTCMQITAGFLKF